MELLHLRYFKTIAELEHMTKAGEILHVAQPSLSKVVRILEKELEVNLFDRVGKNINLNENGKILLKYANKIFASLEDAKTELSNLNRKHEGTLTISMHAASKLLPEILSGFKKKHPNIKFAIVQHDNKNSGEMNCDLLINSTKQKITDDNVITLLEEEILLAVPKDHPSALRKRIRLEEVATEAFISLQKGKDLSDITSSFCKDSGFEPNIILESDDPSTIRGLISAGLGVAFLPAITWHGVADSNIKLLSISNINCKRYINASCRQGRYCSDSTKLFLDFVVDFFKNLSNEVK